MKKQTTNLIAVVILSLFLVSCGTLNGKMSKVHLVESPKGLIAMADGENLDIKMDVSLASKTMMDNTLWLYYTPTVKINKKRPVNLELHSAGRKGSTLSTPKFSGAYFWSNVMLTGLTGIAIDVATKNHKQHPRFVDVPAVLEGKPREEWRSKHKLKKQIKSIKKTLRKQKMT